MIINEETVSRANDLSSKGMLGYLAHHVAFDGMDEDEAWRKNNTIKRGWEIEELEDQMWPALDVDWDEEECNFYLAMDTSTETEFKSEFGDIKVLNVNLMHLHDRLGYGSTRGEVLPFAEEYRGKTAMLLAHLESGGKVTPPIVVVSCDQLVIAGGNHRFGWAKYRKQSNIPILVQACQKDDILERLTVP